MPGVQEEDMKIPVFIEMPESCLRSDQRRAILQRVKAITDRGNVAVFTRQHRILPDITVVKRVTNPEPDEMGDLEADNGWVAPWDAAYTLTEEERDGA